MLHICYHFPLNENFNANNIDLALISEAECILIFFLLKSSVTRFHHPESRKALIRLEQGARSYMNRAIMSHGAFAVIYGLHLKCYIKDPEVSYLFS